MIRRKRREPPPPSAEELENTRRLEDAETRANALIRTAEWIQTTVARRDQDNHWQASVNEMFQGGTP